MYRVLGFCLFVLINCENVAIKNGTVTWHINTKKIEIAKILLNINELIYLGNLIKN